MGTWGWLTRPPKAGSGCRGEKMDYDKKSMEENLEKINQLRAQGVDPYPYTFEVSHCICDLEPGEEVTVAGRLLDVERGENELTGLLLDSTAETKFVMAGDDVRGVGGDTVELLNLGDIVGLKGGVDKDGTVIASELTLLVKIIIPPLRMKDTEDRIEFRHLDLIFNPKLRQVCRQRMRIMRYIRDFFNTRDYLEVDIPILHPYYGGADEEPLKTRYQVLGQRLYLATSPELYLKRLMVGGFEKVYSISKSFREDPIDSTHHPEFTTIEYYQAYSDYKDMMALTEDLVEGLAREITGDTRVEYGGRVIDFKTPWKRVPFNTVMMEKAGLDPSGVDDDTLRRALRDNDFLDDTEDRKLTRFELIMEIFESMVEPKLIQPTFVTDWPKDSTPPCYAVCMCKTRRGDPDLLERFETYVGGMELANAYSELNDAVMQKELFESRNRQARDHGEPVKFDPYFNHALMVGMPPAGGVGVGIDRLVMLLSNSPDIRDVIAFPMINRDYM